MMRGYISSMSSLMQQKAPCFLFKPLQWRQSPIRFSISRTSSVLTRP